MTLQPPTGLPFDDIRALVRAMPKIDDEAYAKAAEQERELIKPFGSLGRMEELVHWLAGWQGEYPPHIDRPLVAIFAGNHGVARHGLSILKPEATRELMDVFAAGGATINQICAAHNIGLKVFDLAVDVPTQDIIEGAALSEAECAATMAFGMEAIAGGADLLIVGEIGAGNSTVASALCNALYGGTPEDWVGQGAGSLDTMKDTKREIVRRAVELHGVHKGDPLELMRRLGGREMAAMAGAILAARHQRVPVILDGFVSCTAAAVLHELDSSALNHCIAGSCTHEPEHVSLLEKLGKKPILDLGIRLGDGSAAALVANILKTALTCHKDTVTFEKAGISPFVQQSAL